MDTLRTGLPLGSPCRSLVGLSSPRPAARPVRPNVSPGDHISLEWIDTEITFRLHDYHLKNKASGYHPPLET